MGLMKKRKNTAADAAEDILARESSPKRKPMKKRHVLLILILALVCVSPIAYRLFSPDNGSLFRAMSDYINSIDESGVANPSEDLSSGSDAPGSDAPVFNDPDVFSFLIIGPYDDSGAGQITADKFAVLSINSRSSKVILNTLSPEFCAAMLEGEAEQKTVATVGDAQALIDGIEAALDIRLDGYMLISSEDAVKTLDAAGGVTVKLSEAEKESIDKQLSDQNQKAELVLDDAGCARLSGAQALAYLRIEAGTDMAADAANRMEAVLLAMKNAANELGLISLSKLGDVILSEITSNITEAQFTKLFIKSPGLLKFRVFTGTIPVPGSYALDSSGALTVTDAELIKLYISSSVYK